MLNFTESLIGDAPPDDAADADDAMPSRDAGIARVLTATARRSTQKRAGLMISPLRPQLFIAILEAGDDGLLIRWVESGRCHYGEQRWRLRAAARPGRCALSGQPIAPGEQVFRPVLRPAPVNGDEMIRPASVPRAAAAGSTSDAAEGGRAARQPPGPRA